MELLTIRQKKHPKGLLWHHTSKAFDPQPIGFSHIFRKCIHITPSEYRHHTYLMA